MITCNDELKGGLATFLGILYKKKCINASCWRIGLFESLPTTLPIPVIKPFCKKPCHVMLSQTTLFYPSSIQNPEQVIKVNHFLSQPQMCCLCPTLKEPCLFPNLIHLIRTPQLSSMGYGDNQSLIKTAILSAFTNYISAHKTAQHELLNAKTL